MTKVQALRSQIFSTGTKFVVSDITKDGSFGPGTTGFASFVKGRDQDYMNVAYLRCAITKRGKTGRARLDMGELSTPIFDFEDEELPKIMPDEKRRYYVHIEPVLPTPRVIQEMPEIDFLAWAMANTNYIHKLSGRAKHVNTWPQDNNDLLNRFLHINNYFSEDPGYAKEEYANNQMRKNFVSRIRIMESTLVRCALSYMTKVAEIEELAIRDIMLRDTNIGKKSVIKATHDSFSNKKTSLQALETMHGKITKKGTKKPSMEQVAGNISWS